MTLTSFLELLNTLCFIMILYLFKDLILLVLKIYLLLPEFASLSQFTLSWALGSACSVSNHIHLPN